MVSAMSSLRYAEEDLGVHSVYTNAVSASNNFTAASKRLSEHLREKRDYEELLKDREVDIIIDEASKHPSMSATAMKEHLKPALQKDQRHKDLRELLRATQNMIDVDDNDKSRYNREVEIFTARMSELGGYLHYLAVIKQQGK